MNRQQSISIILSLKALMAATAPAAAIGAVYSLASGVPPAGAQDTCADCGSGGYCVCTYPGYTYCNDQGQMCVAHGGSCLTCRD